MAFFVRREKKCCHLYSLRWGTLMILWLCLMGSVYHSMKDLLYINQFHKIYTGPELTACMQSISWIFITLLLLFNIIPSILALYGVFKGRPNFIRLFIIFHAVYVVIIISSLVIVMVTLVITCINRSGIEHDLSEFLTWYSEKMKEKKETAEKIVSCVISYCVVYLFSSSFVSVVAYHFLCVVHSYYLKLKEETKNSSLDIPFTATKKRRPNVFFITRTDSRLSLL